MCGIAGFYLQNKIIDQSSIIENITEQLKHRGPDKQSFCNIEPYNLTFIHTRLSILDLSEQANQPMTSFCGNYVISFNGEIYNHPDIRKIIVQAYPGLKWRSTSDTETLLNGISILGLEKVLELVRGMFAFSLYDKTNKKIFLVRDRFGEKPLYWFKNKEIFLWASELKAMLAFNSSLFYVSKQRIQEYLSFGYIKAPNSIFHNISKVKPGQYLEYSISDDQVEHKTYFSVSAVAETEPIPRENPVEELKKLLKGAVKDTMLSDVPLGCFLSGGIDSSLITSMMVSQSAGKINTFTLGFKDSKLDESLYAAEVAAHLGTQHHELIMSHHDVVERIPQILSIIDEPLGDSSVVPTFLLSEFTRTKVKVALSGDGADEIFLGYNRYFKGVSLWKTINKLPAVINKSLLAVVKNTPDRLLEKIIDITENSGSRKDQRVTDISKKLTTIRQILSAENIQEYNKNIRLKWPATVFLLNGQTSFTGNKEEVVNNGLSDIEVISGYDQQYYLPDDILFKVDRSAMACSLETRAPFLNVDVVNFAASLEIQHKLGHNSGKVILKKLLSDYLPQNMINRPKKGFGLPISEWLKGSLSTWIGDLLYSDSAVYHFIDKKKVLDVWKEHITNKADNSEKIWTLACLILWLNKYKPVIK